MSENAIVVENLSKRYLIGHKVTGGDVPNYSAFRDVIGREFANFARKAVDVFRGRQVVQGDEIEEFWALKDVSFEVKQGQALGIVGRNGAGKSTLLKILSRITEPTEGRVELRGRVGSLLEVGTGFHPELTGRENIFLNGAILGMTRRDIKRKFDEIVSFAEVEKFLDTPVKFYSSGMYVRLAFAVAAHLESDILVVDEVLAVGDAEFQKKCLGKMDEVSHKSGRTILFVTHNMSVVSSICQNAIWLDGGSIRQRGAAQDVVSGYLVDGAPSLDKTVNLGDIPRRWGNGERVRLERIEWLCDLPLRHGQPVRARLYFQASGPAADISLGIYFTRPEGPRVLSYDSDLHPGARQNLLRRGSYSADIEIDSLPLAPDNYYLYLTCRSGGPYALDWVPQPIRLEVIGGPTTPGFLAKESGGVRCAGKWVWNELSAAEN